MNKLKTAFSTLSCPNYSFAEILSTAKDFGYNGIEIRGIGQELYAPNAAPFLPEAVDSTINALNKRNLSIPILTTNAYLHQIGYDYRTEIADYIKLAARLESVGTKYIRVLGDTNPGPDESSPVDIKIVAARLREMGQIADHHGITLLVETNGVFAKYSTMQELINLSGQTGIGVLWDIHHPYRYFGEDVTKTYQSLKPLIHHVHIKDSIMENGKAVYKLAGEGDVPIETVMNLLIDDDYIGFISLEWVKRWCADLEEPGIVLMQYINYLNN